MTDPIARQLATFFSAAGYDLIPERAVERAKMAIADTIGSALAGNGAEPVRIIRRLVVEAGGEPEATLWGRGGAKVPAANAARANAVLADAFAFDESHMATVAHLCGVAVPAAIAMAERAGAAGTEMIAAVVLGYEAAGRIGKSISPGYIHERGFHNSVVTIFGGAVAAAKLLGLEAAAMTQAIALAATSAGGLAGSRRTAAREYHAGTAAMLGVHAALAAAHGYRGLETAFEDAEGYCRAFGVAAAPERIAADLGKEWEIANEFAPKLMPGSHGIHTVAEAAAGAWSQSRAHPEAISRITVTGPRWKKSYAGYRPHDLGTAAHSIPYFVARAILGGTVGWDDLDLERIADRSTWTIQDKVEVVEDPAQPPYDYPGAATVTIACADGRSFTHAVEHALGTPGRGFSWIEIEAKYRELAPRAGLAASQLDDGLAALRRLETIDHVGEVLPYLVAPAGRRR